MSTENLPQPGETRQTGGDDADRYKSLRGDVLRMMSLRESDTDPLQCTVMHVQAEIALLNRMLAWGSECGKLDGECIYGLRFMLENLRARLALAMEMEHGAYRTEGEVRS